VEVKIRIGPGKSVSLRYVMAGGEIMLARISRDTEIGTRRMDKVDAKQRRNNGRKRRKKRGGGVTGGVNREGDINVRPTGEDFWVS